MYRPSDADYGTWNRRDTVRADLGGLGDLDLAELGSQRRACDRELERGQR